MEITQEYGAVTQSKREKVWGIKRPERRDPGARYKDAEW